MERPPLAPAGCSCAGCFANSCGVCCCPLACACCLRREAPRVSGEAILAAGNKFVELPDGRKVEYMVSGDLSSEEVVYYQHGYLGSCEMKGPFAEICKELGLKLIAASQPGFGLSDSYPLGQKRTLAEWPSDIVSPRAMLPLLVIYGILNSVVTDGHPRRGGRAELPPDGHLRGLRPRRRTRPRSKTTSSTPN